MNAIEALRYNGLSCYKRDRDVPVDLLTAEFLYPLGIPQLLRYTSVV